MRQCVAHGVHSGLRMARAVPGSVAGAPPFVKAHSGRAAKAGEARKALDHARGVLPPPVTKATQSESGRVRE